MGDFPYKDPDMLRYDGPTLIIRGTKSHYVPDDVLPLIGQFFPKFILRDIESGHWVISESPEAFKQGMGVGSTCAYSSLILVAVVEFMLDVDNRDP